jgi:hypothetical protein
MIQDFSNAVQRTEFSPNYRNYSAFLGSDGLLAVFTVFSLEVLDEVLGFTLVAKYRDSRLPDADSLAGIRTCHLPSDRATGFMFDASMTPEFTQGETFLGVGDDHSQRHFPS